LNAKEVLTEIKISKLKRIIIKNTRNRSLTHVFYSNNFKLSFLAKVNHKFDNLEFFETLLLFLSGFKGDREASFLCRCRWFDRTRPSWPTRPGPRSLWPFAAPTRSRPKSFAEDPENCRINSYFSWKDPQVFI